VQDFTKIRVGLSFDENADQSLIKENKVEAPPERPKNKKVICSDSEEDSDDESEEESEEDEPSPSKKPAIPEEKPAPKRLTAKQRRAIERAGKPKKTGSTFYEYANVKNRNRKRKTL